MLSLVIGILLIFYAMFLTPAYFEPTDIVISTAYIASFTAMGYPIWILILWIISGYVALGIGIFLGVHFAIKVKHPFVIAGIIAFVAIILGYYMIVVNDLII